MIRKTYRTYNLKSLVIRSEKKDGTPIEVVFRAGIHVDSTARFSTTDAEIQEFLENSSGLMRDYYIEGAESFEETPIVPPTKAIIDEKPVVEEKPLTDVKDIRRFHNLVEMRAAMADLGIEGVQEMNYMQCKAAAAKEGYDFQISR